MTQVGVTHWSLEAKPLYPHPLCSGCGKGKLDGSLEGWVNLSERGKKKIAAPGWGRAGMKPVCLWCLILPVALFSSITTQLSGDMDIHTPYIHTHSHTCTHKQAHSVKIAGSRRVSHLSLVMFSELCHRLVPVPSLEVISPTPRPRVNDAQARAPCYRHLR